jgi:hypothetical protein
MITRPSNCNGFSLAREGPYVEHGDRLSTIPLLAVAATIWWEFPAPKRLNAVNTELRRSLFLSYNHPKYVVCLDKFPTYAAVPYGHQ